MSGRLKNYSQSSHGRGNTKDLKMGKGARHMFAKSKRSESSKSRQNWGRNKGLKMSHWGLGGERKLWGTIGGE